jgi:hypothetical protein
MKVFRSILFVIVWLGALAAEIYATLRLWRLSVLPLKHKLIICMILFTAWAIVGALFLFGSSAKKGRHPGLWRRLIAWVLALALAFGSVYSTRVADQLDETIQKVTEARTQTSLIGVYVLVDDPAWELEDAADYTFGLSESYDAENERSAATELRKTLGSIKTEEFDTVLDMVRALYDGEIGAMILNEAYSKILEEQDDYLTFSEDTRILYEITVEEGEAAAVPVGTPKPITEGEEESVVDYGNYDAQIENFIPVNVTKEPSSSISPAPTRAAGCSPPVSAT